MTTVSEYFGANWPPQPGGTYTAGQSLPQSGAVLIKEAFPVRNGHLTFTVEYDGFPSYDVAVKNDGRDEELFQVLRRHVGKTIDDFGRANLMSKVRECALINPGLSGPGTHVVDPTDVTQVWRVTFDDNIAAEIRVSPTESVQHKGKIKAMISELAEHLRKRGEKFPYSTDNLSASLNAAR
jgi:hypothetical protein